MCALRNEQQQEEFGLTCNPGLVARSVRVSSVLVLGASLPTSLLEVPHHCRPLSFMFFRLNIKSIVRSLKVHCVTNVEAHNVNLYCLNQYSKLHVYEFWGWINKTLTFAKTFEGKKQLHVQVVLNMRSGDNWNYNNLHVKHRILNFLQLQIPHQQLVTLHVSWNVFSTCTASGTVWTVSLMSPYPGA